jgi:hypothetical protein
MVPLLWQACGYKLVVVGGGHARVMTHGKLGKSHGSGASGVSSSEGDAVF